MTDSFDAIIDSEVRESRKPKIEPPPGMVGMSSRSPSPRHRLSPHKSPLTAVVLANVAVAVLILNTLGAFAFLSHGVITFVAVLLSGVWFAVALFTASEIIDRLDAAAHWSRQTAETIHQYTASRND